MLTTCATRSRAGEYGATQDFATVGIGNPANALANFSGVSSRGFRWSRSYANPERHREVIDAAPSTPSRPLFRRERRRDRGHRDPGQRRPGVPDAMVAACISNILNFARDRHRGPGRGRRRQGRPVDRAADPGHHEQRKSHAPCQRRRRTPQNERPGRRHLPPSAPVALLERVAPAGRGAQAGAEGRGREHVTEATVIATCKRVEIYAEVDRFHGSVEGCRCSWSSARAGDRVDAAAPRRPLRRRAVSTSSRWPRPRLDGRGRGPDPRPDPDALRLGQELGTVGPALNVLFQQALRVGKRSRAETDIAGSRRPRGCRPGPGPLDSTRAVAGQRVPSRRRRDGRRATATVPALGWGARTVANRTPERAQRLATE